MYKIFLIFFFVVPVFGELNTKNEILSIRVDGNLLQVEIADTEAKRRIGLMYRKNLKENEGMLFVFPRADYLSFWMKNTYIPLSIAYFNEDRRLVDMYDMKPNQIKEFYNATEKVIYALEVNQGWFQKKGIQKFSVLELPKEVRAR
ncbi:MAG: DUF192 domain-containing protein [Leptospiraceae bacterium]|nr:DUF192 domain-containing protein [Leptospiraceae bacterium]NUM41474.1 DUF192 domain-containing protein [Leptospiraceae bacterium]